MMYYMMKNTEESGMKTLLQIVTSVVLKELTVILDIMQVSTCTYNAILVFFLAHHITSRKSLAKLCSFLTEDGGSTEMLLVEHACFPNTW